MDKETKAIETLLHASKVLYFIEKGIEKEPEQETAASQDIDISLICEQIQAKLMDEYRVSL
ncbi:MAG: hypothetical protein GY754_43230 [bacterium]|nr:hypothetical protein [bacterium]